MSTPSPVVVDESGKPAPVVTPELKSRSDQRMSGFLKSVQRRTTGTANSDSPATPVGAPVSGAAATPATPPQKPAEPVKPTSPEPVKKADEPVKPVQAPAEPTKPTVNWEEESKRHQSRADKLQDQLKEFEGKKAIPDTEYTELKQAKERVDAFIADPTGFMLKYAPQLAQQLAQAGDPIKAIEGKVSQFTKQLEQQYKTQYGEDWRFSETEALQPGTPSFRYKLAIEENVAEARDEQRRYVSSQRDILANAEKTKAADKARLKEEFGFDDNDFQEAEKNLEKFQTNYYNLYRLGLLDRIIQKKLEMLPGAPRPSPDLSQSPTAQEPAPPKPVDLQKGTKQVLSRLGVSRLNRV